MKMFSRFRPSPMMHDSRAMRDTVDEASPALRRARWLSATPALLPSIFHAQHGPGRCVGDAGPGLRQLCLIIEAMSGRCRLSNEIAQLAQPARLKREAANDAGHADRSQCAAPPIRHRRLLTPHHACAHE